MYRNQLTYSDSQLIEFLDQGYSIKATKLDFVDIGSFYAFIVTTKENNKLFLKVYPKDQSLVPIHPTTVLLNNAGRALHRFRNEFGITNLSYMIADNTGQFCFTTNELILCLFDYIEGFHPSYSPNQLSADKLANLFFQLHQIPSEKFTCFETENFDIEYALGLSKWINHDVELTDTTHAKSMLSLLDKNKEKLTRGLNTIQQWQTKFSKGKMPFVITHGDAHHYNVLQTPYEVWLVDWDGLKIAPIERDLWHYQEAPLVDEYCKLNPHYKINHNLCEFYRLQRFFEDSRYYLKQVLLGKNSTQEQSEKDKECFLTHWGWSVCLTHLQ